MRKAAPARAAFGSSGDPASEICSLPAARNQLPPLERHEPLADDKRVLFALVPVHRLAGTWQGPGRIADLRRRAGRRA
jgi:hypothetical protein